MRKFKKGDKVERITDGYAGMNVGDTGTVMGYNLDGGVLIKEFRADLDLGHAECKFKFIPKKQEEIKVELNQIKEKNLTEAKKQFEEENKNTEIEFAKGQLRKAKDEIDRIDREIKQLNEEKKPHLEIIELFEGKK